MHVDPTRAQFDAFKALPRDTPIMMINLVRYRDHAAYPDAAAFLEMVTDPDYRAAVINRQAAVLDSRLIRCGERGGSGQGFG